MSKYKFIGTEKDLLDNGFVPVIDNEIKYIKRLDFYNVFVDYENEIYTFHSEGIKDLIDKGLVVEVWQEN